MYVHPPVTVNQRGDTGSDMYRLLPQVWLGNILFLSSNTLNSILHKHTQTHIHTNRERHTVPIEYLSLDN